MAAMPLDVPDEAMLDAPGGATDGGDGDKGSGVATPASLQAQGQQTTQGGKKKKKGRK